MTIFVKNEGSWKRGCLFTRHGGAWLEVRCGWVKQGGQWKLFYGFPVFGYTASPGFIDGYGTLVNADIESVEFNFTHQTYKVIYDESSAVPATQGTSNTAFVVGGGMYQSVKGEISMLDLNFENGTYTITHEDI